MADKQPCTTCDHWRRTDGKPEDEAHHQHGECRRRAPVVVARPNGTATAWPRTTGEDGCEEHS